MINDVVADKLRRISVLLDLEGKDWEVRAFRNARDSINDLEAGLDTIYEERGVDGLTSIDGVGSGIAAVIEDYLETGSMDKLHGLEAAYPDQVYDIISVRGIGPSTTNDLIDELGVTTLDDVISAAENNEIQRLEGYGSTTEQRIHDAAVAHQLRDDDNYRLDHADRVADDIISSLDCEAEPTGALRRREPTLDTVDILVFADSLEQVASRVDHLTEATRTAEDTVKATHDIGTPVVLHRVRQSKANTRLTTTGTQAHVETLSRHTDIPGDYETEREAYNAAGTPFIAPELRRGHDEVQRGREDSLPGLVTAADIRGDCHTHTSWSDGANTVEEMAVAAQQRGYDYIAITDHSERAHYAGGLSETELQAHTDEVRRVNDELDIDVLAGSEVDILEDGSLDYTDAALRELDVVVASPHEALGLDEDRMTERLIAAAEHPCVTVIGHPTGRLRTRRRPAAMRFDDVAKACAANNTALELNSNPARLDLGGEHARRAKQHGCSFFIDTDSHDAESLDLISYGVEQGRRAGLTVDDVVNAQPLDAWLTES